MASRKRSRETDVTVRMAEGVPLEPESFILRTFSSCARELPAAAEEWDVSGFIYDGKHFEHAAVQCWLHCCYSVLYGAAELQEDDTAQLRDARGLHQVLSFAQAVGSPEGLMSAMCSQLDHLTVSVQLAQQTLELNVRPALHCFNFNSDATKLLMADINQTAQQVGEDLLGEQQKVEVQQQVSQQISALLHMAHVLRLQPLLERLHSFIFWSVCGTNNLLYGMLRLVFTEDVLDAALGSSTLSKDTYISSVLSQPCGRLCEYLPHGSSDTKGMLFKPIAPEAPDQLKFQALVLQDFAGLSQGQEVLIELEIFHTSTMRVRAVSGSTVFLPVQLLLGATSSSPHWDALMGASKRAS